MTFTSPPKLGPRSRWAREARVGQDILQLAVAPLNYHEGGMRELHAQRKSLLAFFLLILLLFSISG